MVNYWILLSAPYGKLNKFTAAELTDKSVHTIKWLMGKRSVNKSQLAKGDKILLYYADQRVKFFFGNGILDSTLQVSNESIYNNITVSAIILWSKPVEVAEIYEQLSFVKIKAKWGSYFRGDITKISEMDYDLIIAKWKTNSRL